MKWFIIQLISLYQKTAPYRKPRCVFYPTCSAYAKEALEKHGLIRGLYLSVRRVLRCHPWQKNHIDPVP